MLPPLLPQSLERCPLWPALSLLRGMLVLWKRLLTREGGPLSSSPSVIVVPAVGLLPSSWLPSACWRPAPAVAVGEGREEKRKRRAPKGPEAAAVAPWAPRRQCRFFARQPPC